MTKKLGLLFIILLAVFLLRAHQLGLSAKPDLDQAQDQRKYLSSKIDTLLPNPQAALLSGILIGEKSTLEKQFTNNLQKTSTIHIVVVSGQNLSLVIGWLIFLIPYLGRKKALLLSTGVVLGYSFLTGFQVPVLRAAIMLELGFLAQALGRDRDSIWVLSLTALLMLIYSPSWIMSISFQLSFLATLALFTLSPVLVKSFSFIPDILRQDLAVSLAVQILTWPVIAANFHQISLVGVLVNSLVLWSISPIMISGAVSLALSFIFLELGRLAALVPGTLLTYFVYIINFFSNIPFASIEFGSISGIFWVGYYFLVIGLFLNLKSLVPDG